jgi:cyclopropane fatty-acyl-phospholipid synthase-like methyltransferase
MHHGLWYADETPEVAQLQMVRHLAEEAGIGSGQSVRVLDVGGGMGGSSIYLAEHFGCEVAGITISRV